MPLPPPDPELVAAAKKGRLSLFIGSGSSIPCGGPSWEQLIFNLVVYACIKAPKKLDKAVLEFDVYHEANPLPYAQTVKDLIGPAEFIPGLRMAVCNGNFHYDLAALKSDFKGAMGQILANPKEYYGADTMKCSPGRLHAAVARMAPEWIFTTNYDCCIEDALTEAGIPWRVFTPANTPNARRFKARDTNSREVRVVKLHGCLREDTEPENFIFGEADYVNSADNACRQQLDTVLRQTDASFAWWGFGFTDMNVMADFRKLLTLENEAGFAILSSTTSNFRTIRQTLERSYGNIRIVELESFSDVDEYFWQLADECVPRTAPAPTSDNLFRLIVDEEAVRYCCKRALEVIRATFQGCARQTPGTPPPPSLAEDRAEILAGPLKAYFQFRETPTARYLEEFRNVFHDFAHGLPTHTLLGMTEESLLESFRVYLVKISSGETKGDV